MHSFHFYPVAIVLVSSLSKQPRGWGLTGPGILPLAYWLWSGSLLIDIHVEHKYFHICAQSKRFIHIISPRPYCPLSFSVLLSYSLTVSHCSWINIDTYLWLSLLPYEVDIQMHCSNFSLWENFLTAVVQGKPGDAAMWLLSPSGYSKPTERAI